ncbi:DUF4367 domain-containing protein [Paenibacillus silvae]|uniref:DUF4367 domain-containing protein n=1 Tax=Paenibacillus silvae TaxID=1325358 RepID=A0A2W6NKK1_9BACL|nr:DUF4367 domain-containing protein [Paenibacillus silvae]PZT55618.1 DUF4367 domain-containing protein [Paenibacillus silvae]
MEHFDPGQGLKLRFQKVEPVGNALCHRIMNQIHLEEKIKPKERFFVKYKISFLLTLGLLLTASTGFAAVKYQSLTNGNGDVLFQEKPMTHTPTTRTEDDDKRIRLMNNIWVNQIKPGEAAIIYIVPNNPNQELYLKANSHIIENFTTLQKMVNIPGKPIAKEIAGKGKEKYTFQKASVHMEHGMDLDKLSQTEKADIANKLLLEAQASGKDYALMPVPFTDQFWLTTLTYTSGKKEVSLDILNSQDTGTVSASYQDSLNVTSHKIKINGQDVIQRTYGSGPSEFIWVHEDPKTKYAYHYVLRSAKGNISGEELLRIAKTMIPVAKN